MTFYESEPSLSQAKLTHQESELVISAMTTPGGNIPDEATRLSIEDKLVEAITPRFNQISSDFGFIEFIEEKSTRRNAPLPGAILEGVKLHVADIVLRHHFIQNELDLTFEDVCILALAESLSAIAPDTRREEPIQYIVPKNLRTGEPVQSALLEKVMNYDRQFVAAEATNFGQELVDEALLWHYTGEHSKGDLVKQPDHKFEKMLTVISAVDSREARGLRLHWAEGTPSSSLQSYRIVEDMAAKNQLQES